MVHLASVKVYLFGEIIYLISQQTLDHRIRQVENILKVTLHHTQLQSLLVPEERDRFLRDYASVRFVAGGYEKVGFLRRDKDTPIHRDVDEGDCHGNE